MAKVTHQGKHLAEDEEPQMHVAAEGKRILKDMVAQQLDTTLTIDGQQKRERTFVPGALLDGGCAPSGEVSSASFSALRENDEVRLKLLAAGVDSRDVEKLFSNEKGKLSEPERLARQQLWNEAAQKVLDADSRVDQLPSQRTRLEKELRECVPATGIYAHLVQAQKKELPSTSSKPADDLLAGELERTEKELFGDLHAVRAPSATGRKRRRDRKVADSLTSDNSTDVPLVSIADVPQSSKPFGSLWDVKAVPQQVAPVRHPAPAVKPAVKKTKTIGCSKQRLFTIKDGVIVELRGQQALGNTQSEGSSCVNRRSDRMTIDEITAIPKFSNYQPGVPNKVLFVKNFPRRLTESELLSIFSEYSPVECRVMAGKMKGQAFITFPDEGTAQRAMDGTIGIYIDDKPLVVQFGRSQSTEKSGT